MVKIYVYHGTYNYSYKITGKPSEGERVKFKNHDLLYLK